MNTPPGHLDGAQSAHISVVIPHYNSSSMLLEAVASIRAAARREQVRVEVVVADDGSAPEHREPLARLREDGVTVVWRERNAGRSAAVNLGAAHARCELILILDCDCRPGSTHFFRGHLEAIINADASCGGILATGRGFWDRYQEVAGRRRARQFFAGAPYALTTHNMMVRRQLFLAVGGYDTSYTHYGFEDRDLLIRLQRAGARFALAVDSDVLHCDERLSLATVARKMYEAGGHSAALFRTRFPDAYRSLGYARLDATGHLLWRILGQACGPVALWLAPRLDPWLTRLPFPIALWSTRVITALSYMGGSAAWHASGNDPTGTSP